MYVRDPYWKLALQVIQSEKVLKANKHHVQSKQTTLTITNLSDLVHIWISAMTTSNYDSRLISEVWKLGLNLVHICFPSTVSTRTSFSPCCSNWKTTIPIQSFRIERKSITSCSADISKLLHMAST